jgi:hypothetical protein
MFEFFMLFKYLYIILLGFSFGITEFIIKSIFNILYLLRIF